VIINQQANLGHLGYCTNIHAGESWSDMLSSLQRHVPEVRTQVAGDQAFGIGLRIGAAAANDLTQIANQQALLEFLQESNSYVFSINGFPYGPFHAQSVKENVYAPDWSTHERLSYTNSLADLLANLLQSADFGTISTVPGSFKPWAEGQFDVIAANLVAHVAHLVRLKQATGKHIVLALEPEPFCLLETIAETVAFFTQYLFSDTAIVSLIEATGLPRGQAKEALKEHIGVCYDVCHAAVEYEDAEQSVAALKAAGISIAKLQLSSALRIENVDKDVANRLKQFNEPVYLHQVIQKSQSGLQRYLDLPEALAAIEQALDTEWRVHFHVPVFLEKMQHFGTTQFFLKEILALHKEQALTQHLEVETYTWDVLPDEYRTGDVSAAIAREMNWVLEQFSA